MNLLPTIIPMISVIIAFIGVGIIVSAMVGMIMRDPLDPSRSISGALIQSIFGASVAFFGGYGIPRIFADFPEAVSDAASESDPSTTDTPTPEPVPTPEPTSEPAPEPPIDFPDIPWGTIGIIALVFIVMVILFLIVDAILVGRDNRHREQENIQYIRDVYGGQLRKTMAAFTEATSDPLNTLQYPLYQTTAHPTHQKYINAMMAAYNEQHALDNAMDEYLKRKPERINTKRFENAVDEATECWVNLKYLAEKIGSPLLSIDVQERANKLLAIALDEHNHAAERDLAMSKLVALLEDARETLMNNKRSTRTMLLYKRGTNDANVSNADSVMFVNAMLDVITETQRNNNVLRAPDALLQLAAATDEATRQNLNMLAIQQ